MRVWPPMLMPLYFAKPLPYHRRKLPKSAKRRQPAAGQPPMLAVDGRRGFGRERGGGAGAGGGRAGGAGEVGGGGVGGGGGGKGGGGVGFLVVRSIDIEAEPGV